jgi:hypothetical protein
MLMGGIIPRILLYVQYVKGKENVIVNAFSKRKHANTISIIRGGLMEE